MMLRESGFRAHISPHTLEVASMFAVLSRLEPSGKCDLMTKLRLYDGEEVVEKGRTKPVNIAELREEATSEGMAGISPRFIMKAIDNAPVESPEGVTPLPIREALINMVKGADLRPEGRRDVQEGGST